MRLFNLKPTLLVLIALFNLIPTVSIAHLYQHLSHAGVGMIWTVILLW